MIVRTKDRRLIGYGSGIYDKNNKRIGSVVVLLDEEAVLARLLEYNQPVTLHISVAAKEEIIISDEQEFLALSTETVSRDSYYHAEEHIGITPFSILVTADTGYLSDSTMYFTVAALLTGLILGISLLIFGLAMGRYFFQTDDEGTGVCRKFRSELASGVPFLMLAVRNLIS